MDKNSAAFAGNLLTILGFFSFSLGKFGSAADTAALGKEPSLHWGDNAFEHGI